MIKVEGLLIFDGSAGIVNGKLKKVTMKVIHPRATAFKNGPRVLPSGKVDDFMCFRRKSIKPMGKANDMLASKTLQPTRALKAVLLAT